MVPLSPLPDLDLAGRESVDVVLDRLVLRPDGQTRLAGSLEQAFREGGGRAVVELQQDGRPPETRRYGERFGCHACGTALDRPQPLLFSFNHPLGACAECKGFGNLLRYDEARVVPDPRGLAFRGRGRALAPPLGRVVPEGAPAGRPAPQDRRPAPLRRAAGGGPALGVRGRRRTSAASGASSRRSRATATSCTSASSSRATGARCAARACGGARLKPEALAVTVDGTEHRRGRPPAHRRPGPLARGAPAHPVGGGGRAGGPGPPLGEGLVPPSRGPRLPHDRAPDAHAVRRRGAAHRPRHPARRPARRHALRPRRAVDRAPRARREPRLAELCRELAHAGNTVVVVEHDRTFIESADHCVELGPGSGERGGEIVFAGPREEFLRDMRTLTARYLSGRETIPLPVGRREGDGAMAHRRRRARAQPPARHRAHPAGHAHVRHGRLGLRQVHAGPRHALPRRRPRVQDRVRGAGRPRRAPRARAPARRPPHRPGADRPDAPLEPGHLHQGVRRRPAPVRRPAEGEGPRARARATSRSTSPAGGARRARATASRSSRCTSSRTST